MPKIRVLSAKQVLKIFFQFGFEKVSQKGSHVKLVRFLNGEKQTLTIPFHREMGTGTLKAIFRQATKYVDRSGLEPYFYHEQ